jgi:hypothetical protein
MRIIKGAQNVFNTIAGEVLNIETSSLHFLNGVALKVGTEISIDEYRGYPKLVAGAVVHIIRGASGYIFVPIGTDMIEFQENLIAAISALEEGMTRPDGSNPNVLKQYHTAKCSYNTNIKVKSALSVTQASNGPQIARNRYGARNEALTGNLKRVFVVDQETDSRRGRFTWFLKSLDEIEQDITSDNLDDSIARFACSILYDRDDICKLDHNQTTFEFSKEFLKGYDNIVNENITLFKHGNPLLFELSEHWSTAHVEPSADAFLRNISENKVFEADHAMLKFKPVHVADSTGESSVDICSQCRSLLVGDNYALAGNVKNPDSDLCVAICALCLHSSSDEKPIEAKYFRVFRVTFPRSVDELIDAVNISEQRKELRREALKRVESKKLYVNGDRKVKYIMIGDKYVAFKSVNDFLYTRLATHVDFANRKVCNAVLVE